MTTTTLHAAPTPDTAVPLATVFRRCLAAESGRITSVRSTWWAIAGGAAMMLFFGVVGGLDFAGDAEPVTLAAQFAIVPGQFAFLLVVLLAFTSDWSTGTILHTLQWTPHRGVVLAARTTVAVVWSTAAALLTAAAATVIAWALMGDAVVIPADVARGLGSVALVVASGGVLTAGIATLLRSTAGALTAVFLLLLVLPAMLPAFEVHWLTALAERLPGHATVSLLEAMEMEGATGRAITVNLAVWLTASTAGGAVAFLRRDAR